VLLAVYGKEVCPVLCALSLSRSVVSRNYCLIHAMAVRARMRASIQQNYLQSFSIGATHSKGNVFQLMSAHAYSPIQRDLCHFQTQLLFFSPPHLRMQTENLLDCKV
jgi:hypothetical protein